MQRSRLTELRAIAKHSVIVAATVSELPVEVAEIVACIHGALDRGCRPHIVRSSTPKLGFGRPVRAAVDERLPAIDVLLVQDDDESRQLHDLAESDASSATER